MRFCPIDQLQPSMRLARPLYAETGQVLLSAGVELTPTYITRLKRVGIPGLYIGESETEDLVIPEVISEKTRQQAVGSIRDAFKSIQVGRTFDVAAVSQPVNSIIDEISRNPNVALNLTEIRTYDGYTFGHSVNVCVLSVIMGLRSGLNELNLKELAMGAILHDVGKTEIPEQIITKPGGLSDEEMQEVRKHPSYGFDILRQNKSLSLAACHVAFQHHERPNGKGYPRGLQGDQVSFLGRIAGVADAYDAMTSERVYRPGMAPAEALRVVRQLTNIQFDPKAAALLLDTVTPYPVGTLVRLNNYEVGVVIDTNHRDTYRPVVRVLYQADGRKLPAPAEVDLAKEQYLKVAEVLT